MPRQVYDNVMKFPMPMSIIKQLEVGDKSSDLHYLSFADAQVLPFTDKFQPSLEATTLRVAAKKKKTVASKNLGASRCALAPNIEKLKNRTCFKMGVASRVRGVVGCNNCMKPRCIIYSLSAVSQMKVPLPHPDNDNVSTGATSQEYISYVKDRLHDAMESSIFICGMAPLDPDDPCYGIFECDISLDCETHVEADFYVSGIEPSRKEICCHCAGVCDSLVELNSYLKAPIGPYSVVLPIF